MRLLLIDESNRGDHTRLRAEDKCYHIWEYTSGRDYSFSATNDLISNLKKKPTSSAAVLKHKSRAIESCAKALRTVLNTKWIEEATIVPVPGSKAPGDPNYDDRMARIAKLIDPLADVRMLVRQEGSYVASHEAGLGERVTVEELLERYSIDEALAMPAPRNIGILDDVLTAGTHYRAMHTVLSARFPGIPIYGLFLARRVFPNEFENLDL